MSDRLHSDHNFSQDGDIRESLLFLPYVVDMSIGPIIIEADYDLLGLSPSIYIILQVFYSLAEIIPKQHSPISMLAIWNLAFWQHSGW